MDIGIIGNGIIGGALRKWLEKHRSDVGIRIVDKGQGRNDDLSGCAAIFISIPAHTGPDRKIDLTDIRLVVSALQNNPAFVYLRSTVLPGTCDELSKIRSVIAMPEFLTERTASEDFESQPIIAGVKDKRRERLFLQELFKSPIQDYSNTECELIKYTHNVYGAMEVWFHNITYFLTRYLKSDYTDILDGLWAIGHHNFNYSKVPGPDGSLGFGGKCFPKDLNAYIGYLTEQKLPGSLAFKAIESDNVCFRNMEEQLCPTDQHMEKVQ